MSQIHDSQVAGRQEGLHGRTPRTGLPPPGCGNLAPLRVLGRVQAQVPLLKYLRFREIERNNLDRHSYEVQIKELTEKVSGEETLRTENSKLKDFSKRLQVPTPPFRERSNSCRGTRGKADSRRRATGSAMSARLRGSMSS